MSNRVRLWTVIKAAGALAAFFVIWMASATLLVVSTARGRTYADLASIPKRDVGLVLGCSRFLPDGRRNRFFDNRIRAASDLYRAGKIDYLVVSGDNHIRGYDEPTDMKESLIEAGVPPERIYCDYAGFRTMDSIVRARKIFGQTAITVISQEFHNQRAIFIARCVRF
jgi:SanA protein